MPDDGTIGIYGTFKSQNSTFAEITDSADIQIHFVSAYGREIKSGENKVKLLIKEGGDYLEAVNNSDILNIPVTITITD